MILTFIVILFLVSQIIHGFNLGFTRRIVNLIGTFISFILAIFLNKAIGIWMLQNLTQSSNNLISGDYLGYRFLSFLIIMFAGRFIMYFIRALIPRHLLKVGVIKTTDKLLGGLISFVIAYIVVYLLLSMANALQIDWFVQQTINSPFLQYIVYETPMLSQQIFNSIFGIERTTINL